MASGYLFTSPSPDPSYSRCPCFSNSWLPTLSSPYPFTIHLFCRLLCHTLLSAYNVVILDVQRRRIRYTRPGIIRLERRTYYAPAIASAIMSSSAFLSLGMIEHVNGSG